MLPAVKVFAVAALLGGGAVGTFALAGGFGPKGNGAGNGGTTAQVAATENARPVVTEPVAQAATGVAPAPVATTPTATEDARADGDGSTLRAGIQQREGANSDGQAQNKLQPSALDNDPSEDQVARGGDQGQPNDSHPPKVENDSSEAQKNIEGKQTSLETNDRVGSEPSSSDIPEGGKVVKDAGSEESQDSASGKQGTTTEGETGATSGGDAVGSSSALVTPDGTQTSNGPVSGKSGVSDASPSGWSNPGSAGDGVTVAGSGGGDTRTT